MRVGFHRVHHAETEGLRGTGRVRLCHGRVLLRHHRWLGTRQLVTLRGVAGSRGRRVPLLRPHATLLRH